MNIYRLKPTFLFSQSARVFAFNDILILTTNYFIQWFTNMDPIDFHGLNSLATKKKEVKLVDIQSRCLYIMNKKSCIFSLELGKKLKIVKGVMSA